MSKMKVLSMQLHDLAEEVLILEDRERRYATALEFGRGQAMHRAFTEGEVSTCEWVIQMIDYGYTLKQIEHEIDETLQDRGSVPRLDGGDDTEADEGDGEEEDADDD